MAHLDVRPLAEADISAAAKLLAGSFLNDQGIVVLFSPRSEKALKKSMQHWFSATMHMWHQKQQMMFGAFDGGDLVGVLLAGRTDFRVSGMAQLVWAVKVGWQCGVATIVKTAQHDAHRQHSFPEKLAYIVEFVAVSPKVRGEGVGRILFDQFHTQIGPRSTAWLETTRGENLSIFSKLGYQQGTHSTSLGVEFFQMIKHPTKETIIAPS